MRVGVRAGAVGLALFGAVTAGAEKKDVYALVGARVLTVSGAPLEAGTVVLRDGVIEAVGAGVTVPPDARVIDAKGLTLTPGLIDAFGGIGLPAPKRDRDKPPGEDKDDPTRGLTPQAFILDRIVPAEALKARDQGLTSALVVAPDGLLPGRSVLLNLSGESAGDMVLRQPAALHLHMAPLDGRYPDSLMGVTALARQALFDAAHYKEEWADYERAPAGKRRPLWDARLEAWSDVRAGRLPLVVTAPREGDLRRALALRDEFAVRVVAAGARHAARLAPLLREAGLPLLVSVNFDPPLPAPQFAERDEEAERRDIAEAQVNPAALHRAGVRFALVSGHAADFLGGVRAAIERGLPRDAALRALTLDAADALGLGDRLGSLEPGKLANVVAWRGEPLTAEAEPRLVFVDGALYEPDPKAARKPGDDGAAPGESTQPKASAAETASAYPPAPAPADDTPLALVGATILSLGPAGTIPNGTLLVERGKIAALGADLTVPPGARVIDLRGRYLMPGIIDAHSHTAIEGNVNECTDAVTAEVRVGDVIDARDPDIYRQLAGGVTTIHALHGSCNAIGGQNAVLKLRRGRTPAEMLFEGAPRSIKFALGENPKRSNDRARSGRRYPGTRMGVEALLRREFREAREYGRAWDEYNAKRAAAGPDGPPPVAPRRDLRREAVLDVLRGRVWVHAHCYRADEILMLMRLADEFGFKVRTFQHVLEGYKVAAEIARHGAGASTFIDWWGFKLEAYDATPYNPAVLARHGVLVSLNSDSAELARRLYWDAAKAVRYGGVSEDDALRMITLNPARQLGIDARVGSLEAGKDADVAVFSAHPLSPDARVELTLVDGVAYFDRARDLAAWEPADRAGSRAAGGASAPGTRRRKPDAPAVRAGTGTDHGQDGPSARAQAAPAPVALVGGRIVTVSGVTLENGTLVMADGRIAAVGAGVPVPPGARVIDVSGHTVYPGLIDALTTLGLVEISSVPGSVDTTEVGDLNPQAQAWLALNPHSELIPVARAGGLTTVLTAPGGRLISGHSALVRLAGDTPDAMVVAAPAALHMVYPSGRTRLEPSRSAEEVEPQSFEQREKERREKQARELKRLANLLAEARAYGAAQDAARAGRIPAPPPDVVMEALAPAARGERPVVMRADAEDDVRGAVTFARDHGLKLIVAGGLEAWRCAELLRERDVPVLLNVERLPRREADAYDAAFTNAAALQRAGVRFAIVSDDAHNARNLAHEAAMARAFGLPAEAALRAVTLSPAQIFGLDARLGSLEVGKQADVIVADGDVMDARRRIVHVFIGGVEQSLTTRHTRLHEKFH
jgi:imidazolonepropionase-like amidohydrolase